MKQLIYIFGILLVCQNLLAQPRANFASGLLFDDEKYEALPMEHNSDGAKAILPPRVDLKPFTPPIRNQGELFSCVGWAVGYGALTIERAIQNNAREQRVIAHNASSALFIYNQIHNGNCEQGSRMSDALEFLKENGDCLARDFDVDVNDCEKMPDSTLQENAQTFAIADYKTLFAIKEHPRAKVNKTRFALSQRKPVVIGLTVRRNFYQLQNATYWWPENGNVSPAGGHAMVVIGYDDKRAAFQVMNSWGSNWGDKGFVWIKYKDFGRFCKYAYILFLEKPNQQPTPNIQRANMTSGLTSKPTETLGGNLDFRFVARRSKQSGAPFFQTATATFQGTHYTLNRKDWQVGQLFQLQVQNDQPNQHMYVFSINESGESKIHWPRVPNIQTRAQKPQLQRKTIQNDQLLIPGKNKALKISKTGKEYLIVLFSKQEISALSELIGLLKQSTNDLPTTLWQVLGNKAVAKSDIEFQPNEIGFQAPTYGEGFIVPIILEVNAGGIIKPNFQSN